MPTQRRLRHLSPASLMTQMGRNAAAGLPSSWRRWTEAALDWCLAWFWVKCHQYAKVRNFEPLISLHIMHILFCLSYLLILWTLNKSYCFACNRTLPVSVFCVLQASGVTPLKCGKTYDMDFVVNFMENTIVKKSKIGQHLSKFWTHVSYSGTVFIEKRCRTPSNVIM